MEEKVYSILKELDIKYDSYNHEPLYRVEESKNVIIPLKGIGCKTLFLKNKSGDFYLYVLEGTKRADLKSISEKLKCQRFSFGNEEELYDKILVHPGSVSPLGIINKEKNGVIVLIDEELLNNFIVIHPNQNTSSISIDINDLIKVIEYMGNKYFVV